MNNQLHHKLDVNPVAIPKEILATINAKVMTSTPQTQGYQRAKDLLKNRTLNYGMLKRLKNFFDYTDPSTQPVQFELVGGQAMRNFIEKTLQSERSQTQITNQNKSVSMPPGAMDNTLNVGDGSVKMDISESEIKDKKSRGALAVIVNEENKVLIVKRTPFKGSWMPNKHALIGGSIEEGEEPIDAAKREAMEESGLKLEHFVDSFNIVSPPNTVDYVFIAKAPKNQEVKLNEEHTAYRWASLEEISKIREECVPMLAECVELALNKLREKSIYSK
jgi:dATP pyrophosphohydrolase